MQRLDVVYHDQTAGTRERLADVAFDPAADEVVLVPNASKLRHVRAATARAELIAVDEVGERVIGAYTFNHSAYDSGR